MEDLKVLLVDDDENFVFLVKELILNYSPETDIHVEKNGYDALESLKKSCYDILITDFNMPVMNGLELIRALKSVPEELRPSDVLMLSSYVEPGEPESDVNFVTYLNKLDFQGDFQNYVINKFKKKVSDRESFSSPSANDYTQKHKRYDISQNKKIRVDIVGGNFVEIVRPQNISQGGIYITASRFLRQCELGAELELLITFPKTEAIKVKGKVRHVESRNHFYIGIEFIDMDQKAKSILVNFVEQLEAEAVS